MINITNFNTYFHHQGKFSRSYKNQTLIFVCFNSDSRHKKSSIRGALKLSRTKKNGYNSAQSDPNLCLFAVDTANESVMHFAGSRHIAVECSV